ncbi:MAG: class I SAM-dependent methyltransferase [Burkholderiaceae bacterium]
MKPEKPNLDQRTVESFGDEWNRFDQSALSADESEVIFNAYFSTFPWDALPAGATGFDMGCGTGRWARHVARRVGRLHCIDPSNALDVARRNLAEYPNVEFHPAGVDDQCLADASQDFGYSLGVLHHIPDTASAMASCVRMLKPGAPFLVYLYYAFDNRSAGFRAIWKLSELGRWLVSRMPATLKHLTTECIAALVYYPLARTARLLEKLGLPVAGIPLSFYRTRSFYTMRTDARDRFGTPLEQRFTRQQIHAMMLASGLRDIRFSETEPFWCATGIKD